MNQTFAGVEIGGTKLQLTVGDAGGRIIDRRRFAVDRAAGAKGIQNQIEKTLPELISLFNPLAVACGFGGPVDWQSGRVARSHQIEGWSDFQLKDWLAQIARLPVCVENDANLAAFGEARLGAGVDYNPVFYVTLGSGVGGGLVVDRKIYHGAKPGETEIGHVRLDRQGTTVESRCAGWAVDRKIRKVIDSGSDSLLCKLVGDSHGGEAKFLVTALQAGDEAARRVLEETADDLSFGLSQVVQLLHPETIILGGGLSLMGEPLRQAVETALPRYVMGVFQPGPKIQLAKLGEDTVPAGCLVLARELAEVAKS